MNKATLEQWRMLKAVVDCGGFAQAAEAVHKSQSSINHAVHKLEDRLGVKVLQVVGRKAELTEAGEVLLRRGVQLLDQASQLESLAASLAAGTEAELRVAVDAVYPTGALADALHELSLACPATRVELMESVLSGGAELLQSGEADLLVSGQLPDGYIGEPVLRVAFVAVAAPQHALVQQRGTLTMQDLLQHRQIVVRDSARGERTDSGWLGAEQRWTVSNLASSINMVVRGMGFAWLPMTRIASLLESGALEAIPLQAGGTRYIQLYLVYREDSARGPVAQRLGDLLISACNEHD